MIFFESNIEILCNFHDLKKINIFYPYEKNSATFFIGIISITKYKWTE